MMKRFLCGLLILGLMAALLSGCGARKATEKDDLDGTWIMTAVEYPEHGRSEQNVHSLSEAQKRGIVLYLGGGNMALEVAGTLTENGAYVLEDGVMYLTDPAHALTPDTASSQDTEGKPGKAIYDVTVKEETLILHSYNGTDKTMYFEKAEKIK